MWGVIMLSDIRNVLQRIPEFELRDFYCYVYGECGENINRNSIEEHIISYLHIYLRNHKNNQSCIIKSYIILGWISELKHKYK